MRRKSRSTRAGGIGARILKWIGIVTAVISLVFGIREIVRLIQDKAALQAKVAELTIEASRLVSSGEYSRAWESISEAASLDHDLREAQVEVAMEWLRNARLTSNRGERSFAEIVEKLSPVLHRAIDTTRREYSATVFAHIGWAQYLLFKEGDRSVHVDHQFKNALRLDSTNPYAHAMYGFWILYPGHGNRSLVEATSHFDAALKTGKDQSYVRSLMLVAFRNASGPEYSAQLIKTVNDMRKGDEPIELSDRQWILSDAYFMHKREIMDHVGKLLTSDDHLATFLYLTSGIDVTAKPYLKDALAHLEKTTQR